jgi:hypothetical protein
MITIKKIILLTLVTLMVAGCYQVKDGHSKQINLIGDYQVKTIVYQGCEYVVMESYWYKRSVISHKGNCRFCKERRKQELKELVEQLKK